MAAPIHRSEQVIRSDGYRELERLGAVRIGRPPADWRSKAEWDWWGMLPAKERRSIGRWHMVELGPEPDLVAEWLGFGTDVDGAMAEWLAAVRLTRSEASEVAELDPWSDDELAGLVVGAQEAAELFGWALGTFHKWQHRRRTPLGDMTVNGAPAWWATTIRDWARDTGRLGAGRRVSPLAELDPSEVF